MAERSRNCAAKQTRLDPINNTVYVGRVCDSKRYR